MTTGVYTVYILASLSRRLYIGITNDLAYRLGQHRAGNIPGFTQRYHITRLVHFEQTSNVQCAIAREKQLKGWSREKKLRLIESRNAGWLDLAPDVIPSEAGDLPSRPRTPPA
jgi:putative endonuclease